MVRASGGEGGIPCLTKGKQRGGSKGKIKNRRSARAAKGEASVNARLIEKAKAQLGRPGKVRKRYSKFFCGVGAERIGQGVVDVKVPHHKSGVGVFGEGNQRGHRHLRCPFGPKIIQIQNTKVRE